MCKVQCAKVSVFYEEWNVYAVNNLTLPFQTCSFIDFMRSFASDNTSSVHPKVMEMLMKANEGHAVGYGDDPWTEEATRLVKQQFSRPCEALFVFNGTGSNTPRRTSI